MTQQIANALFGYFEVLYRTNQAILLLCGTDIFNCRFENTSKVLDVIQDIPRLVPFEYKNSKDKLELTDKNGLLEFNSEITFLRDDYDIILEHNENFLNKVRKIRNKYEHKMHAVSPRSAGSSNFVIFEYEFFVRENSGKEEIVSVCSCEFISLIKELNIMFSKIQNEIKKYAEKNSKTGYNYYERLIRFDFRDFNLIYDSEVLRMVGKAMDDF